MRNAVLVLLIVVLFYIFRGVDILQLYNLTTFKYLFNLLMINKIQKSKIVLLVLT